MSRRNLDYTNPVTGTASAKAQQLTRHLKARLQEYFTITVIEENQEKAYLKITLEQFTPEEFYDKLHYRGIETVLHPSTDTSLCFYLTDLHRFEDIDYVWGKLYTILV